MAGQSLTFFTFHQNLHSKNAGEVGGERLDQGRYSQFFRQNAGAVAVGEGGIEVDDGQAGVDEVNAADVGALRDRVRRGLVEIKREKGAEQFFGALLAHARQRDAGGLRVEHANVVIGNEEGYLLGRSGHRRDYGPSVEGGDGACSGASAHTPGVETHAQYGQQENGSRDVKMARNHCSPIIVLQSLFSNHGAAPSWERMAAIPLATALAISCW